MSKRVPEVNVVKQALQSDTVVKLTEELGRGVSSKGDKSGGGSPVSAASVEVNADAQVKTTVTTLFDQLQARIEKENVSTYASNSEDKKAKDFLQKPSVEEVKKGELVEAIRLEPGRDKLLVNQRKLTDRIRKILLAIEAQDGYLRSIAAKVISRKHRGVVIDLPKKEEDVPLIILQKAVGENGNGGGNSSDGSSNSGGSSGKSS